jgi:hypothetical protein
MFLLGMIAVMQSLFVPGLIIFKWIDVKVSFLQKSIYIVVISLVVGYYEVLVLTLLGLYRQQVVVAIFLLELVAVIWRYRADFNISAGEMLNAYWERFVNLVRRLVALMDVRDDLPIGRFAYAVFSFGVIALSLVGLWWAFKVFTSNIGSIFNSWDAVVSWNRWAINWADGIIPMSARNYPQLMPMHWSLTYVFMANTGVQFFAKVLTLPFAFLILLMLFDLGLQKGSVGFFAGIVITYLLLKKFIGGYLVNGYVDGAMAFFAFVPVYTLIKASYLENEKERNTMLWLGFIFAGSAALVKQPGVYIFLIYPFLAYLGVLKYFPSEDRKTLYRRLFFMFVASALIALPWYVFKQIAFLVGLDRPEIFDLAVIAADTHKNIGLFAQMRDALSTFDRYIWLFPLVILGVVFLQPLYRWLVLLVVLPYPLLWAWVASYDARNLSIVLPVLGLIAGLSMDQIFQCVLKLLRPLSFDRWKLFLFLPLFLILLLTLNYLLPSARLLEQQTVLQKQIFSPQKNNLIYKFLAEEPAGIRILTNYPMRYLPGLEDVQVAFDYSDYNVFLAWVSDPSIKYLLVPRSIDPIEDYLDQKIAAGEYELIFENSEWRYYRMIRILER